MLFKTRFHEGLRDGSITLTFRRWSSPRVRVGGKYRLAPEPGALVVDKLDEVAFGQISAREVRLAGFENLDQLKEALRTRDRGVNARSRVHRVEFHYDGGAGRTPKTTGSPSEAAVIADKLAVMDRRSPRGPWTADLLRLIREHPRRRAGDLAPMVRRDLKAFKADERKLKALGLTTSFEAGYGLTPLGRAVLRRLT